MEWLRNSEFTWPRAGPTPPSPNVLQAAKRLTQTLARIGLGQNKGQRMQCGDHGKFRGGRQGHGTHAGKGKALRPAGYEQNGEVQGFNGKVAMEGTSISHHTSWHGQRTCTQTAAPCKPQCVSRAAPKAPVPQGVPHEVGHHIGTEGNVGCTLNPQGLGVAGRWYVHLPPKPPW